MTDLYAPAGGFKGDDFSGPDPDPIGQINPDPVGYVAPPVVETPVPTSAASPDNGGGDLDTGARDVAEFLAELEMQFPWIREVGLQPSFFQEILAESAGGAEAIARLRQAPQYQARFPGLYRADGSLRMTEAQYLAREADYRRVLAQYGYDTEQYREPAQLVGFFASEMAPDELQQRMGVYRQIEESSQAQRDAFYVYAGLNVSVDDLYAATVDPAAGQRLADEYNAGVAASPLDYATWISRATEVGLSRVAETLGNMERRGVVTGAAVQNVLRTNADFARQMMDALYTGGGAGESLNLEDLLSSFEFAAVGAAAQNSGLEMPTRERLAEIRAMGIERNQMIQNYTAYGRDRDRLSAASEQAGFGGLTQDEFERGSMLNEAAPARELERAIATEEARGRSTGSFRFAEEGGRLVQRGFGRS